MPSFDSSEVAHLAQRLRTEAQALASTTPTPFTFCTEDGTGEGAGLQPSIELARWFERWGAATLQVQSNLTFLADEFDSLSRALLSMDEQTAEGFGR